MKTASSYYRKQGFSAVGLFVLILAILAVSLGGFFVYKNRFLPKPQQAVSPQIIPGTEDWLTYRSDEFGFEVKYPKEWTVLQTFEKKDKPLTCKKIPCLQIQLVTEGKYKPGFPPGTPNEPWNIKFLFDLNPQKQPILEWIDKKFGGVETFEKTTIGGLEAYFLKDGETGFEGRDYHLEVKGKILTIATNIPYDVSESFFGTQKSKEVREVINVFEKALQTLRLND